MVAHQTSNGCNLQRATCSGSGTISGTAPDMAGSMIELTQGGKNPLTLPSGETRTFIADGDEVIQRGAASARGRRGSGSGGGGSREGPAR